MNVRLWSVYICHLKILAGRVVVLIHYAYAQKNIMNDGPNTEARRLCVCSWCILIRFQTFGVWTQEGEEKALMLQLLDHLQVFDVGPKLKIPT